MANETIARTAAGVWQHPSVAGLRRLFYLATPSETSFEHVYEVPDYVVKAIPYFVIFIILEAIVLQLEGKPVQRLNDAFSSVSAGLLSLFPLLLMRSTELVTYIWVYENYNLVKLPWDSPWTWWLTYLGVDFCYYWLHRMGHEVNFIWAAHSVHHSSEEYNFTTALRQSFFLKYISWMFYLPLALFLPPSIFLVHSQFSLLYQFWIHTEIVKSTGPLEYILNTPSHHRVHHGRNRYCIDKNFGGTLIIWDRIFGTFESEKEKVVYGLTHPINSWNPIYIQTAHWQYMFSLLWTTPGLWNKLCIFIKGPGWAPGKPRLGYITDIPDVHAPMPKYDSNVPWWCGCYAVVHFVLGIMGYLFLVSHKTSFNDTQLTVYLLYLVWTLTNVGLIYDHKWYSPISEVIRCGLFLYAGTCMSLTAPPGIVFHILRVIFVVSTCLWTVISINACGLAVKKNN